MNRPTVPILTAIIALVTLACCLIITLSFRSGALNANSSPLVITVLGFVSVIITTLLALLRVSNNVSASAEVVSEAAEAAKVQATEAKEQAKENVAQTEHLAHDLQDGLIADKLKEAMADVHELLHKHAVEMQDLARQEHIEKHHKKKKKKHKA